MNVKLSTEPCLLCNAKENTVHAKGKNFQMVVCPKHMIELLKKEEGNVAQSEPSRGAA